MISSVAKRLYRISTLPNKLPNHPTASSLLRKALARLYWGLNGVRTGDWHPFHNVDTYCLFVGHPRSGHSLVGMLLDAHPDIVISNELHAQKLLQQEASRKELFSLILGRASYFPYRNTPKYSYKLPSQYKGKYKSIRVIGDKSGPGTANILANHPQLRNSISSTLGASVKVIHVTRHPLDTIASFSKDFQDGQLDKTITAYFDLCDNVERVKSAGFDSQTLALEAFIQDPSQALKELCGFLGVSYTQSYLQDCASFVFDEPSRSRHRVSWTDDQVGYVHEKAREYSFLESYVDESWGEGLLDEVEAV